MREHESRLKSEIFPSCTEVVWVVGYGGAGKSTFARIAEEFGYSIVGLGSSVRALYNEAISGQRDKRPTLLGWVQQQIEKIGEVQFAHNMMRHRLSLLPDLISAERIVIPSIRNPEVLNSLKPLFPEARHRIIFIDASQPTRVKRLEARDAGEYEEYGIVQMVERDEAEDKVGLRELIKTAEATIKNEGSLENFERAIRSFFQTEKKKNG